MISGDEESFAERHRESFALDKNDSEFRIRRKDGETRWISQQLRVVRHEDRLELFGAARDITKRKLAENALESERDFISAVLDNAAVMFAVLDRDTRIVRINESAAKFAGRSVQELLGTHALTHLPNEEIERLANDAFQRALAGEATIFELESLVEIEGKRRSAAWSTSCIREGGGSFVVATEVDTTDRRVAEEELARHQRDLEALVRKRSDELALSQRRLVDSERLASVGTLASGVAHQINNPIGAILMSSEYALQCEGDGDERETWRSALLTNVEHAKRCGDIVRSILRFSAGERADKWPADLGDILRRVCRLTEVYAKEQSANVEFVLDENELMVLLSPIEMEQVFVNLIRNGIESGDGAVRVRVSVTCEEETVVITITDDGDGIEPERLKYVFDPFYTTRTLRGGTGLGLSVARGIVIDHGGQMRIHSPGKERGTTVVVELPLRQDV